MAALVFPDRQAYGHPSVLYLAILRQRVKILPGRLSRPLLETFYPDGDAMRSPKSDKATIHPNKILRYLLEPANAARKGKPALFFDMGYTRLSWGRLSDDLLAHGRDNPVKSMTSDQSHRSTTYAMLVIWSDRMDESDRYAPCGASMKQAQIPG